METWIPTTSAHAIEIETISSLAPKPAVARMVMDMYLMIDEGSKNIVAIQDSQFRNVVHVTTKKYQDQQPEYIKTPIYKITATILISETIPVPVEITAKVNVFTIRQSAYNYMGLPGLDIFYNYQYSVKISPHMVGTGNLLYSRLPDVDNDTINVVKVGYSYGEYSVFVDTRPPYQPLHPENQPDLRSEGVSSNLQTPKGLPNSTLFTKLKNLFKTRK